MTTQHTVPLARKSGLLIQELSEELLIYDQVHLKAHCLNDTAARIWRRCDGNISVGQLAAELSKELSGTVDETVILIAFKQLSRAKLLEAPLANSHASGISRREILRRAGIAATVALPVVTSIIAPKAAQAANCITSGQPCAAPAQCCSGLCSGAPLHCA